MFTLTKEDAIHAMRGEAVVRKLHTRPIVRTDEADCQALWLTAAEAEALLSLCVLSPACAGNCETELFGKLGALMRSFAQSELGFARFCDEL